MLQASACSAICDSGKGLFDLPHAIVIAWFHCPREIAVEHGIVIDSRRIIGLYSQKEIRLLEICIVAGGGFQPVPKLLAIPVVRNYINRFASNFNTILILVDLRSGKCKNEFIIRCVASIGIEKSQCFFIGLNA